MSRTYDGRYSVLVVWIDGDREVFAHREPDTFEEAEIFCLRLATAEPFEGHRVVRALVVPSIEDAA